MPANNGYISCCPRCAQLFQSTLGNNCPCCGFGPVVVSSITWDDYLQMGKEARHSQAALDAVTRIRNRIKDSYARSSSYYNAQYEQMQEQYGRIPTSPQQQAYVPRCPTCGSPDIRKRFSLGPDIIPDRLKGTFICNNCGYRW